MKPASKINFFLALILALAACSPLDRNTSTTVAPASTSSATPVSIPATATRVLPTATSIPISFSQGAENGRIEEIERFGLGQIFESEYSPDGRLIAYGATFGLYLFDVGKSQVVNFIPSSAEVKSVNFSSDGKWLAFGTSQGAVIVGDIVRSGEVTSLAGHAAGVNNVNFSPGGEFLASSDENGRLNIFQTSDWSLQKTHEMGSVSNMQFLPDGSRLVVATPQKGILTLDARGWGILNRFEWVSIDGRNYILSAQNISISPDGKLMAVALERVIAIPVLELSSGAVHELVRIDPNQANFDESQFPGQPFLVSIAMVAFSRDGRYLAFSGSERTGLVDLQDQGELVQFVAKGGDLNKISFSPEGDRVIIGAVELERSSWDWEFPIYDRPGLTDDLMSSVNPDEGRKNLKQETLFGDGNLVLDIDQEKGTITLRNTFPVKQLFTAGAHIPVPLTAMGQTVYRAKITAAAAHDDSFFVTGGGDKFLKLWPVSTDPEFLLLGALRDMVEKIDISPDGQLVAASDAKGNLYVFQSTGETASPLLGSFGKVNDFVFSPDSGLLAASVENEQIIVWDLAGGSPVILFKADQGRRFDDKSFAIDELVFSPDGQVLVSGGGGAQIEIRRAGDGTLLKVLDNRTWVTSMQFSGDGTILYVDGQSNVRWWGVKQ